MRVPAEGGTEITNYSGIDVSLRANSSRGGPFDLGTDGMTDRSMRFAGQEGGRG